VAQRRRIEVDDSLIEALLKRGGGYCLDAHTGAVLAEKDCPPGQTGNGWPAPGGPQRYVRIPALDAEFAARRKRCPTAWAWRHSAHEFTDEDGNVDVDTMYWNASQAWPDALAETMAGRWLTGLRPRCEVDWAGLLYVPTGGRWVVPESWWPIDSWLADDTDDENDDEDDEDAWA
jgi:hypothetical protein